MNDDQIDDLKQFITATVSQTEARLGERIDGVEAQLDKKIESLRGEMLNGFAGVAEAIIMTLEIQTNFDRLVRCKRRHAEKNTEAV